MKINQWFNNLFNPPFTTEDFEKSKTRCGCDFSFIVMFYDDVERNHPSKVVGYIKDQHKGLTITTWNCFGENITSGKRVKALDLFRPSRREIESSESLLFGVIGILLIIIILLCE